MIKINTQNTEIPVEMGALQFTIDSSDEGLEKLLKKYSDIVKKMEKMKDNDNESTKTLMAESFDALLGKGAFEQIYKQTPSVLRCVQILADLMVAIREKLTILNPLVQQQLKAQEYIDSKKK